MTRAAAGLGLALGALLCGSLPVGAQSPAVDTVDLTILGTTDLHGRVYPTSYFKAMDEAIGLAKVATLIKKERSANPLTLLVDSGDTIQGCLMDDWFVRQGKPLERVHPVIAAMNTLGYTVWGVGNHDFDYGLPLLLKIRRDARYPVISANMYRAGTRDPVFEPYVIREIGGVRVGLIGAAPPGVTLWNKAQVEGHVEFGDVVEAFKLRVPEMKAKGADVVVAIPHSGLGGDGQYGPTFAGYTPAAGLPPENVVLRLAREVPGIDVIFAGHSHQNVPMVVENGIPIVQAGMWGKHLAVARLKLGKRDAAWKVVSARTETQSVEGVAADPDVLAVARDAHERTQAYANAPIATTKSLWESRHARLADTPLIDLINAVQLRRTGADLSAASAFAVDAAFQPGPISIAKVAQIYPYENTLVAVRVTGKQLGDYLEHSARFFAPYRLGESAFAKDVHGFNYDMLAGADYVVDVSRPVGERITRLRVKGKPVADGDTFTLALNSFRARGGGGFAMFQGAPVVYNRDENIRELVVEYLRERREIEPADVFTPNWRLEPAGTVDLDTGKYR